MLDDQKRFVSGSLAGFTVRCLTQPFDVLKIRFQLQVEPIKQTAPSYYSGLIQALSRIRKEEGWTALWKGHVPGQLLSMCFCGVEFAVFYGLSKRSNAQSKHVPSASQDLLHGIASGISATVCCQPLDVMRTRLVAQGRQKIYPGFLKGCSQMVRDEGVLALWRGIVPSCLLIAPQTATMFAVYEKLRRLYNTSGTHLSDSTDTSSAKSLPHSLSLLFGCISGLLAKTIVYPLDLVKKRLAVRGFESARKQFGKTPNPYTSASYKHPRIGQTNWTQLYATWCCFRGIWIHEGFTGLFKGLVPSSIKAGLSTGLTFFFFELYFKLLP